MCALCSLRFHSLWIVGVVLLSSGSTQAAETGPAPFPTLAASRDTTCAIDAKERLYCWDADGAKQLPAEACGTFTKISGSRTHFCALAKHPELDFYTGEVNEHGVRCFSFNGTAPSVDGIAGKAFVDVSAAREYACGIDKDGGIECWGEVPTEVSDSLPLATDFIDVEMSNRHGCAQHADMTLTCWGSGRWGNPARVPEGAFVQFAVNRKQACGIRTGGAIECFGPRPQPPPANMGSSGQISGTANLMCALSTNGVPTCWGRPAKAIDALASRAESLPALRQIMTAKARGCGLSVDGCDVSCWGNGDPDAPTRSVSAGAMLCEDGEPNAVQWFWVGDSVGNQSVYHDACATPVQDNFDKNDLVLSQAADVSFVWSADLRFPAWHEAQNLPEPPLNAAQTELGMYITLSGPGMVGDYPHCEPGVADDCYLPGYECRDYFATPGNEPAMTTNANDAVRLAYHAQLYWRDHPLAAPYACLKQASTQLQSCATSADCCPIPGGCTDPNGPGTGTCIGATVTQDGRCYYNNRLVNWIDYHYYADSPERSEWVLYRNDLGEAFENRALIVHSEPISRHTVLDFTNPEVREYILEGMRSRIELMGILSSGDKDRPLHEWLSVDVARLVNAFGHLGVWKSSGSFEKLFTGNTFFDPVACSGSSGFCDSLYTEEYLDWMRALRTFAFNELGLKTAANIGYNAQHSASDFLYYEHDNAKLNELFGIVDGVLDEPGFTRGYRPDSSDEDCSTFLRNGPPSAGCRYQSFNAWGNRVRTMQALQALGKQSFHNNLIDAAHLNPLTIEFALGSYLIANDGNAHLHIDVLDARFNFDVDFLPQLNMHHGPESIRVDLGLPCAPPTDVDVEGPVMRAYEYGLVIVNAAGPLALPSVSVPLPTPDVYFRYDETTEGYDAPVVESVVLASQQAAVLYMADRASPLCDPEDAEGARIPACLGPLPRPDCDMEPPLP